MPGLTHNDRFGQDMIDALNGQYRVVVKREGLLGEIAQDISPAGGTSLIARKEPVVSRVYRYQELGWRT
jgi:hypothetical protein